MELAKPKMSAVTAVGLALVPVEFAATVSAAMAAIPPIGRPDAFVNVTLVGVPKAPLNVSRPLAAFVALPRAVATPVPSPVKPPIGNPVALVSTNADGVPRAGVTSVGEVANTTLPVPVGVLARVRVTAPVDAELLKMVPSPVRDDTPDPAGVAHAPAPLRNVELEHVPVHREITSADAASVSAPVVVVFLTIPVPRVAKSTLEVPRVIVAVFATPVPPSAAVTGFSSAHVPVVVMVPPLSPVPQVTLVTVPLPPPPVPPPPPPPC